jgi:hypothetical protein
MWYKVALATTLMAFALSSCQTVVRNMPTEMSATKLACDPTTKRCQTPEFGLRQKARQGQRVSWKVETPPGWKLTGNPNAVYAGKGINDVTVLAWDASSLTCQWHAESSSQLFAAGGWVAGYCYAEGIQTPPPAPTKTRTPVKKK